MSDVMSKEQLLREFAAAYERVIATATELAEHGDTSAADDWGPREVIAHLAGWETMATVRVPHVAAGMAPLEFEDRARQAVMTDAINATIVAVAGDQSLDTLSAILRRAYQRDVEQLTALGDQHFQSGQYVYERTRNAIWHCEEHIDKLTASHADAGASR